MVETIDLTMDEIIDQDKVEIYDIATSSSDESEDDTNAEPSTANKSGNESLPGQAHTQTYNPAMRPSKKKFGYEDLDKIADLGKRTRVKEALDRRAVQRAASSLLRRDTKKARIAKRTAERRANEAIGIIDEKQVKKRAIRKQRKADKREAQKAKKRRLQAEAENEN